MLDSERSFRIQNEISKKIDFFSCPTETVKLGMLQQSWNIKNISKRYVDNFYKV